MNNNCIKSAKETIPLLLNANSFICNQVSNVVQFNESTHASPKLNYLQNSNFLKPKTSSTPERSHVDLNFTPKFKPKNISKKFKIPLKSINDTTSRINKQKSSHKESIECYLNNNDEIDEKIQICNCKNNCIEQQDLDTTIQNHFGELINTIKNTIEKTELRYLESERREIIKNEWSDVAMILDRLFCYFFSLLTVITCAVIFLNSPHTLSSW